MENPQGLVTRDYKWFCHFTFDGPEHDLTPDAWRVSPCAGEPNWGSARQNHTTLHSIPHMPSNCHSNSWSPTHLTAQPSPRLTAKLPYHLGRAALLAPDVTQGISSRKADTWPILTLLSSSFLHRNPHRSPSTWRFGSYYFLQLKECLCRRLQIIFTPCASRDADITWHNARKEGMLSFPARLVLLLQVHWENPRTGHTNPSAFNSRELQLQQVIRSPFSQVSTVWLYYFTNTFKNPNTNSNQPATKVQW